jgi:hypothetical protein
LGEVLTNQHIITIVMTLFLITLVGIYSGKKIKCDDDFCQGGNKAGVGIITGTIMGTLVGGASTVGTAQMAFVYGFSAWWFTLGAGSALFSGNNYGLRDTGQGKFSFYPGSGSNEGAYTGNDFKVNSPFLQFIHLFPDSPIN